MLRLSEHFSFEEFSGRDHHYVTHIQMGMMDNLCRVILEPLRKFWGDKSITVASGLRYPSDINALRRKGYNPSETSDHLFGNVIKLRNADKVRRYGRYYAYSVGAADIVPSIGTEEAFQMIIPFLDTNNNAIKLPDVGAIRVGQFIFEKHGESAWIHVSNPVDLIYSFKVAKEITKHRKCFLQSLDGGKTYEPIQGEK